MADTGTSKGEERQIGVIGLGRWGPHYVRVFSQLVGSTVSIACDRNPDKALDIKNLFPHVEVTSDPAAVLSSEAVDAVVIATPASTHFEIALACLKAKKDVLVEKPLALTVDDCQVLTDAADRTGLILMVGHTFIYNAGVRKMRELVEKGELGNVYYLLFNRTHLGPIRDDVSALWDLAPHDISIASFVLGSLPIGVSAVAKAFLRNDRADVAFVTLYFPGGVIANLHVSWIDSNKERRVVVVGSEKRVVFDDLNNLEQIRIFEKGASTEKLVTDFGEFKLLLRDGDIISPRIDVSEPLRNMCTHFIDCINTREKPLTDGKAGADVVRVMEAIEESLDRKGGYVDIEW